MVLATAMPITKAATKLKKAAHTTATLGVSTRVDTTVAMLLAASWNPLKKSKQSATPTVMINKVRLASACILPVPIYHCWNQETRRVAHALLSTTVSSTLAASSALSV